MSSTLNSRRPRSQSARIGTGLRASWNTTIPLRSAHIHPSDSRGYIVDSNFLIPRVRDLESEFQRELGKCLFDRTVQFAEEGGGLPGNAPTTLRDSNNNQYVNQYSEHDRTRRSASAQDRGSFSTGAGPNRESMRFFDSRRYLNVRPTRCTSALVQKNERFDTYFVSGTLDKYAVANAMGPAISPHPPIEKDVHRMNTANKDNLRPFSVREAFTDKEKEDAPDEYWKQKAIEEKERLEVEEKARIEAEERARVEAIEQEKREREEEKARLIAEEKARREAEDLLAMARAESDAIKAQLTEVEKARDEALTKLETLSTMSTKSKGKGKGKDKGKKGKGKKGKGGASSDGMSDISSASGKKSRKTILKSSETDDNSSSADGKKVTFKEKLVSTKTISPRGERAKSPKRSSSPGGKKKKNFPGSARSKSGSAKVKGKKKKKKSPEPPPEVAPEPEPVPEPEPPTLEELMAKLPQKPKPIVLDEPPMFCLATEYKTRQQMVEEWLYVRSCSACPTSMPLA